VEVQKAEKEARRVEKQKQWSLQMKPKVPPPGRGLERMMRNGRKPECCVKSVWSTSLTFSFTNQPFIGVIFHKSGACEQQGCKGGHVKSMPRSNNGVV
jgi:hypothetical protein